MFVAKYFQLIWILTAIATIACDEFPCPKGAWVHLASLRCYWLNTLASSWVEAETVCRKTEGGDLARINNAEDQDFIQDSFPMDASLWVWLVDSNWKGSHHVTTESSQAWEKSDGRQGGCPQMALGSLGQWRNMACGKQFPFLCQKEVEVSLPSPDTFLVGVPLMSGMYSSYQPVHFTASPDTGQQRVEMMLFPGLWFSHAGQVLSVEMVVRPTERHTYAKVQIFRPYCKPSQHLVPPGCVSLHNPFSCCFQEPLCNTTGGCVIGQHWCHLLDSCVPVTSPCSPYYSASVGRSFSMPPRLSDITPFYHLVADIPLDLSPSSELVHVNVMLPEREIIVYPDDILAIQHTKPDGGFLHCVRSSSSPWRQSYISLPGPEWGGWLAGGLLAMPPGSQWVDGVVCDLRVLYADVLTGYTTSPMLSTGQSQTIDHTHMESADSLVSDRIYGDIGPRLTPVFGIHLVYPTPDQEGQIHIPVNTPTLFIIKIQSGSNATSSWSAPVSQTGIPFLPSCPPGPAESHHGCEKDSADTWFSHAYLALPEPGSHMLNVTASNHISSQSVSVRLQAHQRVRGLTILPHGDQIMLVGVPQVFNATVDSGSTVKYIWVIDDLLQFAYEGEAYSVVFKKPAHYKLTVVAENPVSSQSVEVMLAVEKMSPMAHPSFVSIREIFPVSTLQLFTFKVKVDTRIGATFWWDFGDNSPAVNHSYPSPSEPRGTQLEPGVRQTYLQDTISHSYQQPGDYKLNAKVFNQYDRIEKAVLVKVRSPLAKLVIWPTPSVPSVNQTFDLEALAWPSSYGILYRWNFGSSTHEVKGVESKISHVLRAAGVYNVTVKASNSLSELTTWLALEIAEDICGIQLSSSAPDEFGSVSIIEGSVSSGTSLLWTFDMGDGSLFENISNRSMAYTYRFPGNYTVRVTVKNEVSQAFKTIRIEVYKLTINGILPTGCSKSGHTTYFRTLVTGNAAKLTFYWNFGDGTPVSVIQGISTASHIYELPGKYEANVTVFSSVGSTFYSRIICMEELIAAITVTSSKDAVAVNEEVCFSAFVQPKLDELHTYQFLWDSSCCNDFVQGHANHCFIFKEDGNYQVSVEARNNVSRKTAKAFVAVIKPIVNVTVKTSGHCGTMAISKSYLFWVETFPSTNFSVLWDMGDGTPKKQGQNISHAFRFEGRFKISVTVINGVSQHSTNTAVVVMVPLSNLTLQIKKAVVEVGEEVLITAVTSVIKYATFNWSIDATIQAVTGTPSFAYTFPRVGLYHIYVTAQNNVSKQEAAGSIEVLKRIQGVQITSKSFIFVKYIPTQENVLLSATVTGGSNLTYFWMVLVNGKNRSMQNGEHFQLFTEAPGDIFVEVTVSNRLGKVNSSVLLRAEEHVSGVKISTTRDIVAVGKPVEISVSVRNGTSLQFLWYVGSSISPLSSFGPSVQHTFSTLGPIVVKASVSNMLGYSEATKLLIVQEEIQKVTFKINDKMNPFFVSSKSELLFFASVEKGNYLTWEWECFSKNKGPTRFGSTQSVLHSFTVAGVYQVLLNVSNNISWQTVTHKVNVQDAIQGLNLNVSSHIVCTDDPIIFMPVVLTGSDVHVYMDIDNGNLSISLVEKHFILSSLPVGNHTIMARAWNNVSSSAVTLNVQVVEKILGLRLVNCCRPVLESLKEISFEAEVLNRMPTIYRWNFSLAGFQPSWAIGPKVVYTPIGHGTLTVNVVASNGFCSQSLSESVSVEWPVQSARIVSKAATIFVGQLIVFSVMTNNGSNLRFKWKFGDSDEARVITDSNTISHTYYFSGRYVVQVTVLNTISQVVAQLPIEARNLECALPRVALIQKQSIILRSRPSYFEANVDLQGCVVYKTSYLWEAFFAPLCREEDIVPLSATVDLTIPLLKLPKHALAVGTYCLRFTAALQGTPLLQRQSIRVTVVHSPLIPLIKGGSHRIWSSNRDLLLEGTESHDPDYETEDGNPLQYQWDYIVQNPAVPPSHTTITQRNSSTFLVSHKMLCPGSVYLFTLTVYKRGRPSVSTSQSVVVQVGQMLSVSVACVSCSSTSPFRSSYNQPIVLSGSCLSCNGSLQLQYQWSAESWNGNLLELSEVTTSTGKASPDLVIRPGVLVNGLNYTFTLNASQPTLKLWGSASLILLPNRPPRRGVCKLSPDTSIHLLETLVTYKCSGWVDGHDEATQLIYSLKVEICQHYGQPCLFHTLYRGTRNTCGAFVPLGFPDPGKKLSIITVLVLVEDYLGSIIIALNRTLVVLEPKGDQHTTDWLRNKSQSELWALIQKGNPQEVIPYTIALSSQLNQIENVSEQEHQDRVMIRGNMTQMLASLPVSSLQDAVQIGSALAQCTADPRELVCDGCKEKVLEATGKMITTLREQTKPGDITPLEAGRSILHVLGSAIAADAGPSVTAHSNESMSLAASDTAVFAFDQAGDLMRSLMRPRMRGEEPLTLAAPRISAMGQHSDPAALLCTEPSSSCSFHIPRSLGSQLRMEREELVQIVMDLDGRGPLVSAAEPPISTKLASMEFTTLQGRPIVIQDLHPDRAIRVMLQNHHPAGCQGQMREQKASAGDFPLPPKGSLSFLVKPPSMDPKAGLFITFNFSFLSGTGEQSSGQVIITVDHQPAHSFSQHLRNLSINLSAAVPALEETIFLSPLQNGSGQELYVSMSSSVNGATMQASLCVFSSLCQYFSTKQRRWSSEGLWPLGGSNPRVAHCLTQHLTVFGASMFVHPEAVILLPPPERPVTNVVVGIVCGVLLLLHLLVGLIAHKLDHLDSTRLSSVPLCGQPGRYQYRVLVKTGWARESGTTAHVGISLYGLNKSGSRHLQREGAFQRNALDDFQLETEVNLCEIWKIRIWHDNTGLDPSWYLQHVIVWDRQTDNMFFFLVEDWLSVENEKNGGMVEKEVLASCPQELQRFWRILRAQLTHGMMERHIWASVWECPAHSNFTRAQRVTCCALLLHLYLAVAAAWFGATGSRETRTPVSDHVPVNAETLVMGMTVAVLVFPLQLLFCFLFRNTCSKVTLEETAPPTPACQTVEMDVYLDQSKITSSSFLSLPRGLDSIAYGGSDGESLGSKKIESDFWSASRLSNEITEEWWASSCSLFDLPVLLEEPVLSQARLLKRKKALLQLRLGSPDGSLQQAASPSLTSDTLPTMCSDQDLINSLAADSDLSGSSSGRVTTDCGPSTPCKTVLSDTQDSFCGSWSQTSQANNLFGAGLYKSASSLSVFSTASTFLPSPSPDSLGTASATRIGVARSAPSWCFPSWMLRVIYLLIGLVLGLSLAVVRLYGSSFSGSVLLMWLISATSAFMTSVLLLEPLKVFVQALYMAIVVRPVDPEVDERLAQDTIVRKVCVAQGGKVRPPCGYGLLHAKEEARKVRVLRSLMKSCVVHVLFLLVVLLVNYQSSVHDAQVRLLHSAVKHWLLAAPPGSPKLSKLAGRAEVWQWMDRSLIAYIHENPSLSLVGSPQLQRVQVPQICCAKVRSYEEQNFTSRITSMDLGTSTINSSSKHLFSWLRPPWCSDMGSRQEERVDLGSSPAHTRQLLFDLQGVGFLNPATQLMSVKFTQHHRETSLFVSVTIMLRWAQTESTLISVSIQPFHMPPSSLGPDLHIATTVLLLLFALSFLGSELWAMVREKSQYSWDLRSCLQLLVSLLSLGSAALRLSFLYVAASRLSHLREQPHAFVSLHDAAQLAHLSCQLSALLLTLLVLKMVGALRFVRRWVVFSKVLRQACRELCGAAFLYALLLLLFTHIGCMLFSHSVEGFRTAGQAILTLVSALRGRAVVRRLCEQHPVLGPLYCLALLGMGLWALSRLCGVLLLHSYRIVQTELYRPAFEPQDYEMVEFFIKRLKLWIGLSKSKEFRHKVKFEGMASPPSRSSQGSQFSGLEVHSPAGSRLPSALSLVSDDSIISESYDVQCYLDRLLPAANSLLTRFERVNQVTDDLHVIEQKLLKAWTRISLKRQQRDNWRRSSGRESASPPIPQMIPQPSSLLHIPHSPPSTAPVLASYHTPPAFSSLAQPRQAPQPCSMPNAAPANGNRPMRRVSGTDSGFRPLPWRRAWHSGTAHSADIGQRPPQVPGNSLQARPKSEEGKRRFACDEVPVKRRAWQPEGPKMWTDETYWNNLHDDC